jgi:hypothetical protein
MPQLTFGVSVKRPQKLAVLVAVRLASYAVCMEQHELVRALAQLQAELSKTDQADPEALDRLRALTAEVDRLVDEREATSEEDAEGVSSGLNDLILKFESDHPELAMTLGKVADALASMGI